ncbi:hypothetical protein FRACYDRAFT_240705 [Fragilariopsis cylindrus CCMP1102]|uniref:Uncharacterized protein n=1 Tax=Fragilariopsis cylindrus CCMP1102 TaxID=635003 RepID=A0A1E7F7U1_9STRA|nr:hypothetical protein FRACYDRAFT_240705 [Fragilariopsis cylindrus CCMP1102]|eukprot:OEU14174.1 hypothetical protein FRACYDRAFT_240705 [Fragilariopsis cylindrus CCMP1102]
MVRTTTPRSNSKTSRFRHNDYKPFLKYIERQSNIDPETHQRIKDKFANSDNNNNSIMSTSSSSSSSSSVNGKLIEIDTLRGQVIDSGSFRNERKFSSSSSSSSSSSGATISNNNNNMNVMAFKVPLLTIMLAVGVLLVASKFLKRKLHQIRSSDSLMANYNYNNHSQGEDGDDSIHMVELQSQSHTNNTKYPAIFVIDNNNNDEQQQTATAAAVYKAPSETTVSAGVSAADVQFV